MRRRIILPTAVLLFAIGCSDSPEAEDPVNLNNANNQNNENNSNNANNQNNLNNANNENNQNNVTPTFAVDIRADTNRDGTIDFDDVSDDEGEERWDATKGAIFLANMDDDEDRCPTNVNDIALAECFDGADEVVNGEADLKDFARIEIRATEVPEDATGEFRITRNADRVRLFRLRGDAYEVVNETETLSTSDLSSGVVFFLEGRDIVRDDTWDGFVDFTVTASSAEAGEQEDQLQMRVAPLLMQHHLLPPRAAFASELGAGGDGAFTRDLGAAVEDADFGTELVNINVNDQWTQDYFEVAYMSMPTAEGMHTIDVFVRSANVVGRNTLRQAGRFAYFMHGEDVAGLTEVDWNHDPFWDTLNSFGNAETIPPHEGFPVGRILRGKANGLAGDNRMYGMFEAQKVQEPLYVDTGWLLVGHIDETVSFIKDHNADSWKLVMNDAALARTMLQQAQTDGFGDSVLHSGRRWVDFRSAREIPADVTVDQMLNNANVMAASAEAAIEVSEQVETIQAAVGLDEERIIGVPFMHETQSGYSVAYQPGVVNGISLGDEHFGAPEMHGPVVNGADIFAEIVEERFTDVGVTVHWIEDWDMFHRFQGEVHCGSNTQRIATDAWWTSPRGGEQ